jgi:hypothetical protein
MNDKLLTFFFSICYTLYSSIVSIVPSSFRFLFRYSFFRLSFATEAVFRSHDVLENSIRESHI